MVSNTLDALDRLFDGVSSVIEVQALLFATGQALRGTPHLPHFEGPATELLAVIRSGESVEEMRERALTVTDELRHYLAELDLELI